MGGLLLHNQLRQCVLEVAVCVWVEVAEEHSIIIILKGVFERQTVINPHFLFQFLLLVIAVFDHIQFLEWDICGISFVPKIADVISTSMPALFLCIVLFLAEHADLHAFIIKTVDFQEVYDCQFNLLPFLPAHDREVKPL